MKIRTLSVLLASAFCSAILAANDADVRKQLDWLKQLEGDWVLSAGGQEGKATEHKTVAPLLGTDVVAMNYRLTGKGSTLQETILPGTAKEMVTMYHCNGKDCRQLRATHYCVKQNQPQLLSDAVITDNTISFSCDESTELCRSGDNHIHEIELKLSDSGNHLKETFATYVDGKHVKDSIYHFDRKQ